MPGLVRKKNPRVMWKSESDVMMVLADMSAMMVGGREKRREKVRVCVREMERERERDSRCSRERPRMGMHRLDRPLVVQSALARTWPLVRCGELPEMLCRRSLGLSVLPDCGKYRGISCFVGLV